MDFEKLNESIDKLLNKLKTTEAKIVQLKQRETELLTHNQNLQNQMNQAQSKIQAIVARLKSIEEAI